MKFKEFLTESFLTDKDKIKEWLDHMGITNFTINTDFTVDVHEDVDLNNKRLHRLPIKFGIVNGDFDIKWNDLTNFIGFPFEIIGDLYMDKNQITSLVGINDVIKSVHGEMIFTSNIKEGGLGLLLIKHLKDFSHFGDFGNVHDANGEFFMASFYINKYLGTDNIIECQSELIEAGLEQYAIL